MPSFKEAWEKASKKKKEYIILFEEPIKQTKLWRKSYISFSDKDNAIELFDAMKQDKTQRNVRFICPINMEKLIKFAEKMKELNEDN